MEEQLIKILEEYNKAKENEDPTAGGWVLQELKAYIIRVTDEVINAPVLSGDRIPGKDEVVEDGIREALVRVCQREKRDQLLEKI